MEDVIADSQDSAEMHLSTVTLGQALKDGVSNMEVLSPKVIQLCDSQGLNLEPSAMDVIMRAVNPQLYSNDAGKEVRLKYLGLRQYGWLILRAVAS